MHHLLERAKEEQDLFWLSMGFDSSDGEKDEDFDSKDGSRSAREDSFDSDFSKKEKSKNAKRSFQLAKKTNLIDSS